MQEFTSRDIDFDGKAIVERFSFLNWKQTISYISVYEPQIAGRTSKTIVICDSLWDEQERTLVFNTRLARSLAAQGYVVVRFDYTGSGNSGLNNDIITFQSLSSDVVNVTDWILHNYQNVELEALICERVGCHILYKDLSLAKLFKKNIFIHPILNIGHFFSWNFIERELINTNAFNQKKIHKSELLRALETEDTIDLNGYTFNSVFIKDLISSPELWLETLPIKNCTYFFDENFYRSKKKCGSKIDELKWKVIKMDSIPVSTWDREDLRDDTTFFYAVLADILTCLS